MIEERFEKDAIEFENNYTNYKVVKRADGTEYTRKTCNVTIQEAYVAGAICGYNKVNEESKGKCKTAYIKGIRTMANALKDYDRTDGAWTDYFEHTVDEVLKRLLKESI